MKKVLSIVLALAMVLCMIPALAADVTTNIEVKDQSYLIDLVDIKNVPATFSTVATTKSNSRTFEYKWTTDIKNKDNYKSTTGKWTEDKHMAIVSVGGFTKKDNFTVKSVLINNKELTISENADYADVVTDKNVGLLPYGDKYYIKFPVELTEEGYTETYYISVISKNEKDGDNLKGATLTENAKITLTFKNKDDIKATKDAYITNIAMHKCGSPLNEDYTGKANTYIVGSKIYVDFFKATDDVAIDITFADENKAPFTGITYAWTNEQTRLAAHDNHAAGPFKGETIKLARLNGSVATFFYKPEGTTATKNIVFELETEQNKYKVAKKYDIISREYVHEADPKGIYLDKSEVTIAVGEEYTPVIKAQSNGAILAVTKVLDAEKYTVIDYVKDSDTKILGVKPGVAYIRAEYKKDYTDSKFEYVSSTQKITVTLPGESIPAQTVDYVVTCRNLNVRKGAGTSFGKAGMVHRGNVLKVVEVANGWAKLADGTYVCAKYITK